MGVIISFGTHINENPPRQLFRSVVQSGIGSNGSEMPIFGQKCQFWANFGRFWAKNPFWVGMEQNFWYPHIREPKRHLFRVENIDQCSSDWPLGTNMCNFDPKIWIFGAKSQFQHKLSKFWAKMVNFLGIFINVGPFFQ